MHFLVLLSALLACAAGFPDISGKPKLDGRIVGGNPADITNYPYQVSLLYTGSLICGGAIINANWVVTAAKCVNGLPVSSLSVRAGSTYCNTGGTLLSVTKTIVHPSYDSNTQDYDVGLVQVSPSFTFSGVVQPITLEINEIAVETNVVVTGWGITSVGGAVSLFLNYVTVQIVSEASCYIAYAPSGGITARMICAGVPNGGKGPCLVDTGGPLVAVNSGNLVGMYSGGIGCASAEYPSIYTKVSAVRSWIVANAV